MDVSEYRRRSLADVDKAGKRTDQSLDDAVRVLRDVKAPKDRREAAARTVGLKIDEDPSKIDDLLAILTDPNVPAHQRTNILYLLRQISFRSPAAQAKRPEYLSTLRAIVDDPDPTLRRRAIGTLAREKDEYVQRRLIDGLEGRGKALVPAAKAIQLLGNDVNAETLPLIHRFVEDPPNKTARKEAIRLLAADPTAVDLLVGIVRDHNEDPDVRRTAATALQSIAPDVQLNELRRIALDDAEPAELRAMALTTLTQFDDGRTGREMAARVEQLASESSSRHVKQASRAFVSKYSA